MLDVTPVPETKTQDSTILSKKGALPQWESPKMEDVSEQVMAQPYIRFT